MREPNVKLASAAVAFITSIVMAPACVYDFDGLREPTGAVDSGGGGELDTGEDVGGAETGPEVDMGDAGEVVVEYVFGAACEDDEGCGEGVCAEGFCTASCAEDPCESGATCADLGGGAVCVPRCDLGYACDRPGGADLSCTQALLTDSPYSVSSAATFVCRADGDADGVSILSLIHI